MKLECCKKTTIMKKDRDNKITVFFVGLPGFEPRQTEPKTVVLPLHNNPILMPFLKGSAKIGGRGCLNKFFFHFF